MEQSVYELQQMAFDKNVDIEELLGCKRKNNTLNNFGFEFDDKVDDALIDGLEQNTELFILLLNNENIKKQVMHVFVEDIYQTLKI